MTQTALTAGFLAILFAAQYVISRYRRTLPIYAEWKTFKSQHPMAASYSEDVRKADLGDKGTWYRLRMGSFADKAAASTVCEKLKSDGGNCLVAK